MWVRIKQSGQEEDMVPNVAMAMIQGGTAEPIEKRAETTALEPAIRKAVTPAQDPPKRKPHRP